MLVEIGLTSGVFFALLLGIITFGGALYDSDKLAGAAKTGARWAIVNTRIPPADCATAGGTCQSAIISHIVSGGSFDRSRLTATITFGGTSATPSTYACSTQPSAGCWVNVALQYRCTFGLLSIKALRLTSSAQMVIANQY